MEYIADHGFYYIYILSGFSLVWYKPALFAYNASPDHYSDILKYWCVLSCLLFVEFNFINEFSTNLGYYFIRTLFFFYLSERRFINATLSEPSDSGSRILNQIRKSTEIKTLCSLLSEENEIPHHKNIHPWAPSPTTISVLAVCRIGELAATKGLSDDDLRYLSKNGLSTIIEFLQDTEDAKSINALLAVTFLTDTKIIKNEIVNYDILPMLKRFINGKDRLVADTALKASRNVYHLNKELQKDFIKLGCCGKLVERLKEFDPLKVLECIENIFSLICNPEGDVTIVNGRALLSEGLINALECAENNHKSRKKIQSRVNTLREICSKLQ